MKKTSRFINLIMSFLCLSLIFEACQNPIPNNNQNLNKINNLSNHSKGKFIDVEGKLNSITSLKSLLEKNTLKIFSKKGIGEFKQGFKVKDTINYRIGTVTYSNVHATNVTEFGSSTDKYVNVQFSGHVSIDAPSYQVEGYPNVYHAYPFTTTGQHNFTISGTNSCNGEILVEEGLQYIYNSDTLVSNTNGHFEVDFDGSTNSISLPKIYFSKGGNVLRFTGFFDLLFDGPSSMVQQIKIDSAVVGNNSTDNPNLKIQAHSTTNDPIGIKIEGNGRSFPVASCVDTSTIFNSIPEYTWQVPSDLANGTYKIIAYSKKDPTFKEELEFTVSDTTLESPPASVPPCPFPPCSGDGSININVSRSPSPTPTISPTNTPLATPTNTISSTPTPTPTITPTATPKPLKNCDKSPIINTDKNVFRPNDNERNETLGINISACGNWNVEIVPTNISDGNDIPNFNPESIKKYFTGSDNKQIIWDGKNNSGYSLPTKYNIKVTDKNGKTASKEVELRLGERIFQEDIIDISNMYSGIGDPSMSIASINKGFSILSVPPVYVITNVTIGTCGANIPLASAFNAYGDVISPEMIKKISTDGLVSSLSGKVIVTNVSTKEVVFSQPFSVNRVQPLPVYTTSDPSIQSANGFNTNGSILVFVTRKIWDARDNKGNVVPEGLYSYTTNATITYSSGRVRTGFKSETLAQLRIAKNSTSSGGKSLSEILIDARPKINKKADIDQWEKLGNFNTTYQDFNDLAGTEICNEENKDNPPDVIRVVTLKNHPSLPSGTKIIARSFSRGTPVNPANFPTLEFQYPDKSQQKTKIRYVTSF